MTSTGSSSIVAGSPGSATRSTACSSRLGSDQGRLIAHPVPEEILNGITKAQAGLSQVNGHVGPHGLEVVVDDRDNQPYV